MSLEIKPYNTSQDKTVQVRDMFDAISPRYDMLNHILTLGIDKLWRRRLVRMLNKQKAATVLDVATGTGDLAILIKTKLKTSRVVGVDLSEGMLSKAKQKAQNKSVEINWIQGDAQMLRFAQDGEFDAVTAAFGVRNFEDIPKGLSEIFRVLNDGGKLYVLELTTPRNKIIRSIFRFYFFRVLPLVGRCVSRDARAYSYLPKSVEAFSETIDFQAMLQSAGYRLIQRKSLTFGIATIFCATK